jgi:hypothetical protein
MKNKKLIDDYATTSFMEGQDADDHFKLEGDLDLAGIM